MGSLHRFSLFPQFIKKIFTATQVWSRLKETKVFYYVVNLVTNRPICGKILALYI